jgi:hypothetical protein
MMILPRLDPRDSAKNHLYPFVVSLRWANPGLLGSKGLHRWEFTGHIHHLHPWQKITNALLKIGFLGSVFQAKVATQDVSSARD